MPGLEDEEYFDSDVSDSEEKYSKLVNFVSQLDSTQRVKPASRKEISSEVSEYNLTKGTLSQKPLVEVKELAQVLGKKSGHVSITKKLKEVTKKSRTLPKPLEKPVEERLKRSVGFENVKRQLRKWEAVVARNALKDHIKFPLVDHKMRLQPSSSFLKQFKASTPLEMEMAKILKQEIQPEEEEKDEFPLTLEEMMEKRKEMAQLRAKLSYREARAQRQSKIKSKKYHRILKREKMRQQLKEFELLQKTDPEAALKKLEELDKSRAKERASLRHRNTGLWAKNIQVRAKYDVESRKILADQLKMSREITQKAQKGDSSDEEETVMEAPVELSQDPTDTSNPWSVQVSKEVFDFAKGYKKYWAEQNKKKENQPEERSLPSKESVLEKEEVVLLSDKPNALKETKDLDREAVMTPPEEPITEMVEDKTIQEPSLEKPTPKKKLKKEGKNQKSPNTAKSRKKVKDKKKKFTTSVNIHPTSGIWIVETVSETPKKKKDMDIDTLFKDLNDRLLTKAAKRVKRLEKEVRKEEKKMKKIEEQKTEEFDLSLKDSRSVQRPDMDVELLEGNEDMSVKVSAPPVLPETTTEIDPKNFIQVKPKKLNSHLPETITGGDDVIDDEDTVQQMTIEEAFGDDDVLAEFKELKEEEEKSKEIEIRSTLPGWGEWGGVGIVPDPRKKKRLILKPPPRRNKKKEDTIINENENPNLRKHLVKEVPFPFKSIESFEANIRAPVGRDWVPETTHRSLIQKQVETQMGAIIDPMDEEEIIRRKKKTKSPYQGKKKTAMR